MSSFASLKASRKTRLGRSALVPPPSPAPAPAPPPPAAATPIAPAAPAEAVADDAPLPSPPPTSPPPLAPAPAVPTPELTSVTTEEPPVASSSRSSSQLYAELAPRVEVRSVDGRGRGVFVAKRRKLDDGSAASTSSSPAFNPGERIVALQPHAHALSTSSFRTTCDGCLLALHELRSLQTSASAAGPPEELLVCGGCRLTRYCSKACQTSSWPSHKPECRGLSSLRTAYTAARKGSGAPKVQGEWIPSEAVRALGRLAAERRRRREGNHGKDDPWWEQIASLQSHRATLPMLDPQTSKPTPYAQLAISLAVYLGHCFPRPVGSDGAQPEMQQADMADFGFDGVGEVMDLCCAFMTNSFTLSSPSLTPIGVAINPTVALFNHSCWPNAAVVFPSGTKAGMHVVALRPIGADEEVVTSYVDISLPAALRRQALERQYYFECACELCSRGPEAGRDPREATVGAVDGIEEWVKQGMAVLAQDEKGLITTLDDVHQRHVLPIVQSLAQVYAPTAYPLFPLLRLLNTVLISALPTRPDVLADSLALATVVTGAISHPALYPAGHPARGVALAEFGKLLLVPIPDDKPSRTLLPDELFPHGRPAISDAPVGRLVMAREVLVKALDELRVGFGGDGGLVGFELRGLVEGVGREVQGMLASQRSLPM